VLGRVRPDINRRIVVVAKDGGSRSSRRGMGEPDR
jgi:hypothetical protein